MKSLLLLLLISAPLTLLAQEEPEEKLSHHALGLSASMLSAPGISYQYIFNPDHRIKITGFGYYEKSQSGTSDLTAIIGGEYQYTATGSRNTRFYIEIGGYYWHDGNSYSYTSYPDETTALNKTNVATFAAGAGIGVEVAIEQHFLISIDGSLLYRKRKTTYSTTGYSSYEPSNHEPIEYFGPGIGFAAYYRF